ncbi:hypothetical protein Dthio_PD0653 [Desulfonatronospira thiodismutans ASO3-1]|uniref:Uncharacterized protein n=1 Tax=Desulfonatronospira thiodismutans ASO3-1 TaxID=555779 RepID=D6SRL0_9BACT|nr:hypothetical protein Dthio_PD0653 [Desulfonatronospira thiodismutans ASO3-1]
MNITIFGKPEKNFTIEETEVHRFSSVILCLFLCESLSSLWCQTFDDNGHKDHLECKSELDLLLKPCLSRLWRDKSSSNTLRSQKTRKFSRKDAKYAKLKTRSRCIVQNRATVLDKAAFLSDLCLPG